jgi:hypothetical protein
MKADRELMDLAKTHALEAIVEQLQRPQVRLIPAKGAYKGNAHAR